jgi:hypothetical protein
MSSKLTMWTPVTVEFFGQSLELRLRLLPLGPGRDVVRRLEELRRTGIDELDRVVPEEWIADVFARWVRLPEPVEIDGVTVSTGSDLLAHAGTGLVLRVVGHLARLTLLAEAEGKASGSPSTPPVADASVSAGSSSPAESTESGGGPTP